MFVNAPDFNEPAGAAPTYAFGPFRLDSRRRVLFRGSLVIPIPERIFQLLLILIEANGELVQRETIALRVWPDTDVSDGNIAQHVYCLRRLLGEHAHDRAMIMTANRRGYRLTVPVHVERPPESTDTGPPDKNTGVESFCEFGYASYLLERRNAAALRRAIDVLDSRLQNDPYDVPALIGIARAYSLLAEYWHVPASGAFGKAKEAVRRALSLAPLSGPGHAVLANLLLFSDWNWAEAKSELDAALRLNPNSSIVRNNAVYYYICAGEYDAALFEAKRALMLEPSSLSRQLLLGLSLVHAGQYRQGVACLSSVVDSDGEFYIARRYRAQALLLNEQPEEALAELLVLPQERSDDLCLRLPLLGRAFAQCGERSRAEQIYSSLREMAKTEFIVSWNLALVAVGLGQLDQGMAHLERAFEEREPPLLFLKSLPWFPQIADRSRFKEILGAVGPGADVTLGRSPALATPGAPTRP
jgi:DNA-binding winged helix-turn-helix (wHTH) protein/tetratricopeptide (TPR) repeat protein